MSFVVASVLFAGVKGWCDEPAVNGDAAEHVRLAVDAAAEHVRAYQETALADLQKQADAATDRAERRALLQKIRNVKSGRDFVEPPVNSWPTIMSGITERADPVAVENRPKRRSTALSRATSNAFYERAGTIHLLNVDWEKAEAGSLTFIQRPAGQGGLGKLLSVTDSGYSFQPQYWTKGSGASLVPDRRITVANRTREEAKINPLSPDATMETGVYYIASVTGPEIIVIWVDSDAVRKRLQEH